MKEKEIVKGKERETQIRKRGSEEKGKYRERSEETLFEL